MEAWAEIRRLGLSEGVVDQEISRRTGIARTRRKLIIELDSDVPKSLRDFADAENLPEGDVQMLATIRFRGDRPQTAGRWRHIYEAIKMSRSLDA